MKRFSIFSLVLALLTISSCGGSQEGKELTGSDLIHLKGASDKSVYLTIVEQIQQDTTHLFKVKAVHEGDTVGFDLVMAKEIAAGINDDGSVNQDLGFVTGNIQFLRSGEESDRFVAAMAGIWDIHVPEQTFSTNPVIPLVFSSNKEAVDYTKPSTSNFKLFLNPELDEPGELNFTLDTYLRRIEIQVMDTIFYQEILNAFSGSTVPVEQSEEEL